MIEINESKEFSKLALTGWGWEIMNDFYFGIQWTDTIFANGMTKEL